MVPRRDWFLMQPPSALHGYSHAARVMVWATVLAGEGPLFEAGLWAAACHDLRRQTEDVDPGHGERAAIWVLEELPRYLEETPEHEAQWRDELLWLLKDADALDRVRIGDLNPRFLRTEAARELVESAEDLYKRTRKLSDPVDVWSEAFRLGLPIDRLLDFEFGLRPEEAPAQ